MSEPFITVYTIDGRPNKLVTRRKGKVCKEAGSPFSKAVASSLRVDTAEMLADLLRAVGDQENSVISLGYIPGTEPTGDTSQGSPYTVLSQKKLAEKLGVDPDDNNAIASMVLSRFSSGYLIANLAIKETDHGTTIR